MGKDRKRQYYKRTVERLDFVIDEISNIKVNLGCFTDSYSDKELLKLLKQIKIIKNESAFLYQDVDYELFNIQRDASDNESESS